MTATKESDLGQKLCPVGVDDCAKCGQRCADNQEIQRVVEATIRARGIPPRLEPPKTPTKLQRQCTC